MKLPGMGDVKNKNVAIGAGVVGGIVLFAYIKRKKRQQATTANGTTTTVDPNAIDPATGVPYGQEAGSGGGYYTGFTPGAGSYVSQTGTATAGTTGSYTSNSQWESDALQDAQNFFGVSYSVATSGLGKYLSQSPQGLNDNEYTAVSEVVALIGQPPVGGPYRLIHGAPSPNPPGDNNPPPPTPVPQPAPAAPPASSIPPGYHMQDPQVATLEHGTSMRTFARWNYPIDTNTHLNRLIQLNPGLSPDDTNHATMFIRTSDAHLVPNV